MNAQKKFHLVFSIIMGAMMISLMTFFITAVNIGFTPDFLVRWGQTFLMAYAMGVPVIFFLAPIARKLTGRLLGTPSP